MCCGCCCSSSVVAREFCFIGSSPGLFDPEVRGGILFGIESYALRYYHLLALLFICRFVLLSSLLTRTMAKSLLDGSDYKDAARIDAAFL